MKFCVNCKLCMKRTLTNGHIVYECVCGHKSVAENHELCIFHEVIGEQGETIDKYATYIKNAANDATVNLIKRTCENCGAEYMKHLHVSDAMISVYVCSCGGAKKTEE